MQRRNIAWQSKLLAFGLILLFFGFTVLRLLGNSEDPNSLPTGGQDHMVAFERAGNDLPEVYLERQGKPGYGSGPLEKFPTDDSVGLLAHYQNCSVLFSVLDGDTISHLAGSYEESSLVSLYGETRRAEKDDVEIRATEFESLVIQDNRMSKVIATLRGNSGRLLHVDNDRIIVSYSDQSPDTIVIAAFSRESAMSIWETRQQANGWPVMAEPLGQILLPIGNPQGTLHDQEEHIERVVHRQTIIRIDAATGQVAGRQHVALGSTSFAVSEAVLFMAIAKGDALYSPSSGEPAKSRQNCFSLAITTIPAGAYVEICGRQLGPAPLTATDLPSGSYSIRVSLGAFAPQTKEIQIESDTALEITLAPAPRATESPPRHGRYTRESADSWESGNLQVRYSAAEQEICVVETPTNEMRWQAGRVNRPIALDGDTIAYSVVFLLGDTHVDYLVAQAVDLKTAIDRRKTIHLWQSADCRGALMANGSIYVRDGDCLIRYDAESGHRIWSRSADARVDAVFGIVAGAIVTGEAGDLVYTDVRSGAESLRYRSVLSRG